MNRCEAYEYMKQGGYITHPILMDAKAGPLYISGNKIFGKHDEDIDANWEDGNSDVRFNIGWIKCDEKGNPLEV